MSLCEVRNLETVAYENGMAMQERLVERRKAEQISDQLLLLEHPSVITRGKSGSLDHLHADAELLRSRGVRYYETTRGGDVTWHGPGQIVGYPIVHLGEGNRDVRKYVEKLETVLVRALARYGIEAEGSAQNRGVWVGDEKIAAIGVRMSRWVTSHGFALNVDPEFTGFELITPCGIEDKGVTSMARLLGTPPDPGEVRNLLVEEFAAVFDREITHKEHDLEIVKVVVTSRDQILLLERRPDKAGFWQPVTGRLEAGESFEEAARRELAEETGIQASSALERLDLVQSFVIDPEYLGSDEIVFVREHLYRLELDSRPEVTVSPEEHRGFEWLTVSQALERIRWADDREAIETVAETAGLRE